MRPERAVAAMLAAALLAACASGGPSKTTLGEQHTQEQRAAQLNVRLAQGYIEQNELEIARDKLVKALALDPKSADAHSTMAVLYERIGRSERAEEHFRRAVELEPEKGNTLNNYGTYLCRHGRYDEADAMFRRALDDPFYRTPAVAASNAGLCALSAGNLPQAEAYLRRTLEASPRDPTALLELARLHFREGDFLRARAFMQRLEASAPPSARALALAADIETRLGDARAAERYRTRLQTEFPDYEPSGEEALDHEPKNASGETNSP